jgi:PBP1b-binding outer membrane lipoprotein LpoB
MGENMKKMLIILMVVFGVFLAIGCAGQREGTPNQTGTPAGEVKNITPAEAGTPAQVVTPVEVVTPVKEVVAETPVVAVTPVENYTVTEKESANATQNVTKHVSSTQRKKERILENTQSGNNTSGNRVIKMTPSKGS